jgi:hypothetical protein
MSSYGVIWRNEEGMPLAGSLEFTQRGLWLHGGHHESEEHVHIPYGAILGLERDPQTRIGRYCAITIFSRNAGELLVASVGGIGILTEIVGGCNRPSPGRRHRLGVGRSRRTWA